MSPSAQKDREKELKKLSKRGLLYRRVALISGFVAVISLVSVATLPHAETLGVRLVPMIVFAIAGLLYASTGLLFELNDDRYRQLLHKR